MGKLEQLIKNVQDTSYTLSQTMYHMRVYGGRGKHDDKEFINVLLDPCPNGYAMQALKADTELVDALIALVQELQNLTKQKGN